MAENIETVIGDETIMSDQPSITPADSPSFRNSLKQKLTEHGGELREKAQTRAFDFAAQGKDKATDTLDSISRFISDTAATLEEQLGSGVGGYVNKAAEALSGFTDTLKSKDVEDLFDDAREAVRKNPAIAIGAAAAAGFVLMRLIKSASGDTEAAEPKSEPKSRSRVKK